MTGRKHLRLHALLCLCVLQCRRSTSLRRPPYYASAPPRLVLEPLPSASENATVLNVTIISDETLVDNQVIKGYVVTSNDPSSWSCVVPQECKSVKKTSGQARRRACQVATNGGPFQSYIHGGCFGGVVTDEKVISSRFSPSLVGFGRSEQHWVFGGVANQTEAADLLGLQEFVTGFGWLVYNGKAVPINENDTGAEKAARTAIGIDRAGRIMILVVDGCERCLVSKHRGFTLQQLAALLVRLGARHAINLDGGGSSTFVAGGKVVNFPTCMDVVRFKCERPVTTVMCLKEK